MSILVVGSVALDSIETPFGKKDEILGGSATFFSISASFFDKVNIIATVGDDFPKKYLQLLKKRGIGTDGIEVNKGKTFRWEGLYEHDMNVAHTLATHLNVFQDFAPMIPRNLRDPGVLFLANIDPDLQDSVLRQVSKPKLIACDSMNHWITNKKSSLEKFLHKVDIFLLNDAEARQFSGESNLMKAAKAITSKGPKSVVIKKGEHGVIYYSKKSHFVAPAYPLENVYDPTGAGDTFAGGVIGYLSRAGKINDSIIRKSMVYGSIMASFAVEDFSVNRLLDLKMSDINKRYSDFKKLTRF
ncbi:MAG: PfkB family carbohydrate kinase [Candidatus Omnitrophota bacterium]|nr:PfkB family carbohydrate kinase [Candidatus Omnitrophota bacterium]